MNSKIKYKMLNQMKHKYYNINRKKYYKLWEKFKKSRTSKTCL